jgi:hypothetical protein
MKDSENKANADDLAKAVKIVQEAIRAEAARYKKIAQTEEQDPVMLEGRTRTGYYCEMMVDPKDVAKVFLDYDYPVWHILEEEPPEGIWDRLAEIYGLDAVNSVDI